MLNISEPLCSPPELWGGVECTINRVQNTYNDQLIFNGHADRIEDLDLFAQLGIRALRYPVLWERFDPEGDSENINWSWADKRLHKLRDLDIHPIVGLVHHGSGPRHTSLTSPDFALGLAEYARRAAERYPWVEDWTPVNEPLTTARFCGLYGYWYPHARDEQSFARALVTECRAVALAMQAIRKVNPSARLVQTDDLGKIYSTPRLKYQADFENDRRWITWDLLTGLVDRYHRMWNFLRWCGIPEEDLYWFLDNPCPPDIIGINYYLTSERYLDEHIDRYPAYTHGGNGKDRYADVEAVRALPEGVNGAAGILQEAWQRYGRPLAITEAHLGCTREEQMRWLHEVWQSAVQLRNSGVDVRAVTAWALLGSYDWNSLLTQSNGHYESGVFDLRGGKPRPTALTGLMKQLSAGQKPDHPVLAQAGWWRQSQRLIYRTPELYPKIGHLIADNLRFKSEPIRPLLITGAKGTLGYAFARLCHLRNLPCVALSRQEMDITDLASVEAAIAKHRPWAVINAAGYVRVDDGERDETRCYQENTSGAALLATMCARHAIPLVTFSSDLVFNGRQSEPYKESCRTSPLSVYGKSKARAEELVLEILPSALVVRTSAFFGPWDESNFVTIALRQISAGRCFLAADDAVISPTYVPDLVHACLDLLIDGESGIWHLANEGAVTWKELSVLASVQAGLDTNYIEGCKTDELHLAARRPLFSALGSERGQLLQSLDAAIQCYLRDCCIDWSAEQIMEHESRPDTLRAKAENHPGPRRKTASYARAKTRS